MMLGGLLASAAGAEPLSGGGRVELAPPTTIQADGREQIMLRVRLQGADPDAARVRGSASHGPVGGAVHLGGGLYELPWIPGRVERATRVTLTVRVAGRQQGEVTREVLLVPGDRQLEQLGSAPERLVLGASDGATLSIQLSSEGGWSADDLALRTSAGEISDLVDLGQGRFRARYHAPQTNFPQIALVSGYLRSHPSLVVASGQIPLFGKVDFPVPGTPGEQVYLALGAQEFGPVEVGANGQAQVPIVVQPGMQEGTRLVVGEPRSAGTTLDLQIPSAPRLMWMQEHVSVRADGDRPVPIRVMAVRPDGLPDLDAPLSITASAGRLGAVTHVGQGVHEVMYTPPLTRSVLEASLLARLDDDPTHADAMTIRLVPVPETSVRTQASATSLGPMQTALSVDVDVRRGSGRRLAGQELEVEVFGGVLSQPPLDLGAGDYRIEVRADGGADAAVWIKAPLATSEAGVAQVVGWPLAAAERDGAPVPFMVMTLDAQGLPVSDAAVRASVPQDAGLVDLAERSDASGRAFGLFWPHDGVEVATIQLASGAMGGGFGLSVDGEGWQSCSSTARALLDDLAATTSFQQFQREGQQVHAFEGRRPLVSGALNKLEVQLADGVSLQRGRGAVVQVVATDSSGLGVEGLRLQTLASDALAVSKVVEQGQGRYLIEVDVQEEANEEVKLSVFGPSGDVAALSTFDVSSPTTASSLTARALAEPPSARQAWLRASGAFLISGYGFQQLPSEQSGAYFDEEAGWGGAYGGAPAPLGGQVEARITHPAFRYLGFAGQFRSSSYTVQSDAYDEDLKDVLLATDLQVLGQAPIPIGRFELLVGGRIGYRYDDFPTLTGCLGPGCTLGYGPLGVSALSGHVDVGIDAGPLGGRLSFGGALAQASVPYAFEVGGRFRVDIHGPLFAQLGLDWVRRDLTLDDGDAGALVRLIDEQAIGTIGLGVAL